MKKIIKITFNAETIQWERGGTFYFGMKTAEGVPFNIEWGDSKITKAVGGKDSISYRHDYCPRVDTPKDYALFHVEVFSEDENFRVTELSFDNGVEMKITKLDISRCTELERLVLRMLGATSLDVSKNTSLKYLDCHDNKLTSLDISNNIELEELKCSSNNIKTLNISNNIALRVLDCELNGMTRIIAWFGLPLKEAAFRDSNNLNPDNELKIIEIVESNGGNF
jgi:hypothetical protein